MTDLITRTIDRIAELTGDTDGAKRVPALGRCSHCGVAPGRKHQLVLCTGNRRDRFIIALVEAPDAGFTVETATELVDRTMPHLR